MIVLGLHFGHDATVAVLRDGVPVVVIEKERTSRIKHAIGLDHRDVTAALAQCGLGPEDVDYCSVTSTQGVEYLFFDPELLSFRIGPANGTIPSPWYDSLEKDGEIDFLVCGPTHVRDSVHQFRIGLRPHAPFYVEMIKTYGYGDIERATFLPPLEQFIQLNRWAVARTFAAIGQTNYAALLSDDFRKSFHVPITLTLLGRGVPGALFSHHYAHAAYAFYDGEQQQSAIISHDGGWSDFNYEAGMLYYGDGAKLFPLTPHFMSIGNLYNDVGTFIGMPAPGGAGKLMGLSAYGGLNLYRPEFAGNLYDGPDQELRRPSTWCNAVVTKARELGYDMEALADTKRMTDPINVDIAAAVQRTFEDTMLMAAGALSDCLSKSGIPTSHLSLTGGAALNCPANSRLYLESAFDEVFIPPSVGDSGLAVGSAYALYHSLLDMPRRFESRNDAQRIYLGSVRPATKVTAVDPQVSVTSPDDAARDAARIIADDGIVAWFEGRSELGPRALGHRSILSNPQNHANWLRVNKIKHREPWRPLAPSVLAHAAGDYFTGLPLDSPFMLFNADVTNELLPAVTHVDGTSRIQTVGPESGDFYRVLEFVGEFTGVPVVMNTSFNGPGEPIIETPDEAIAFFLDSELDALFVNGTKITHARLSVP